MKTKIITNQNQLLPINPFAHQPISRGRLWLTLLWLYIIACSWLLATVRGSTPPPADPIGTAISTFDLVPAPGSPTNMQPYGLAFDFVHAPHRLYVSDHGQLYYDHIFVYEIGAAGLTELPTERIISFDDPRGLALAYVDTVEYLYALESNPATTGGLENRLWRFDLTYKTPAVYIDLNHPNFGIVNRELLGLEYYDGDVFIGYDTTGMADAAVHSGILRLKVITEPGGTDWWARAGTGDIAAIIGHLPNGGRTPSDTTIYEREPCRGLAAMFLGDTFYLWGTSLGRYIYSADGPTGRGLFFFDPPPDHYGVRWQKLYDLAFGDNYLWAVQRTDANHPQLIQKIKVASDFAVPLQSNRHVRTITMTLSQKTTGSGLGRSTKGIVHSYMLPNPNTLRPNQDRDLDSLYQWCSHGFWPGSGSYNPAEDSGSVQDYGEVQFKNTLLAKNIDSGQSIDVWTSDYGNFVYPHLCSTAGVSTGNYVATTTEDDLYIDGLNSDPTTYSSFMAGVDDAMLAEYGPTAVSTNPYWIARNVTEFIHENFDYGTPNKGDRKSGEGVWNPVHYKLQRFLEDGAPELDLLTCSSAAFVSEALFHSVLVPARWVGTTHFLNSWDSDDEIDWDRNGDGLMGPGEWSVDENYHRWAEVWLGPTYRWQRFDSCPNEVRAEQSQFDMMKVCAHGVYSNELVTTVGKGYTAEMFDSAANQQYYNTCGHYNGKKWTKPDKCVYWSVPCLVDVGTPSSPQTGPSLTVTWTLVGPWDLDPTATVSIYAEPDGTTDRIELKTGIPASAGSASMDISDKLNDGFSYRLYVTKDADEITGGKSDTFLRDVP